MAIPDELAAGRLPHLGILRFSGPDAISFLQGQVSNDTAPLARGAPVLAAYSTAQGRVLAIMHLLPHSTGVLAVLPRELAADTHARLRKFVLRAKVKIEDLSGAWSVAGREAEALQDVRAEAIDTTGYLERNGIGVARLRPGSIPPFARERFWLIGEAGASTPSADAAQRERDWRLADIRDGLPQVYTATTEAFVAQMLNLDLLGGISFTKGCYTGQEIIARTQHLGRIKRRLSRLRLPSGSWSIGQPLRLKDGRTGRLTEVVGVGEGFEALAVLTLDATAGGETDTGSGEAIAAEELPLPYRV